MDRFFPVILDKYKKFGLSNLTPAEVCLTSMQPSFSEYFYEQTGQSWGEIIDSYLPILENHLEHPDKLIRFAAGKVFLQCLDQYSANSQSIPKYSISDDAVLKKISDCLKQKNLSLMKLLIQSDVDSDGFMNKSELVSALEKLDLSPYDVVSCIRIAGFRPEINFVPIAGFCDLIGRSNCERRLKEFNLLTKVLNVFSNQPGGVDQVFRQLDRNRDGKVSIEEFRTGLRSLEIPMDLKDCKSIFALLDRDNSKSISLIEFKKKLQEMGARPKRILPAQRNTQFDPPGEFVIKFLNGSLPHDAVLNLELQKNRAKTTLFPVWGETIRIKASKRLNCSLTIEYQRSIGILDIAVATVKESKLFTKIGHFEVGVIVRFENVIGEDFKEMRAAVVIQKAWRRFREKFRGATGQKKLICRKTVSAFGKRFLMGIYKTDTGVWCQLHPAFTDQIPQDTILSCASFQIDDVELLMSQVIVNPNLSLSLNPDKSRIRGNLWVELIKLNNISGLSVSLGSEVKNLQAVGDKVEYKDIKLSKPTDLNYIANNNQGSVFWFHALSSPYKWSVPSVVLLPGKTSFSLRFRWLIGARLGELEQAAILIQKQWKEKQRQRKSPAKRVIRKKK